MSQNDDDPFSMANVLAPDHDILGTGRWPVFDFEPEFGDVVNRSWDENTPEFMADWDDSAIQSGNQCSSDNSGTIPVAMGLADL